MQKIMKLLGGNFTRRFLHEHSLSLSTCLSLSLRPVCLFVQQPDVRLDVVLHCQYQTKALSLLSCPLDCELTVSLWCLQLLHCVNGSFRRDFTPREAFSVNL